MSYAAVTQPLPAAVRRETGRRAAAVRDTHVPPHLVRWLKDDRVLVSGGDRAAMSGRAREKLLVPQVNELMYELTTLYPAISGLQPEWGWDVDSYGSPDGLPVIGPHRNFPRHLFALGNAQHGAGVAWLAARVLLRAYLREPAKGDERSASRGSCSAGAVDLLLERRLTEATDLTNGATKETEINGKHKWIS